MTTLTDMTRFLLEKGVALEVAFAATEIAEKAAADMLRTALMPVRHVTERDMSRDRELENLREAARIRKRRSRDKQQMSRDVTGQSRDLCDAALVPQVKNLSSFSKDSKILNKTESLSLRIEGCGEEGDVCKTSRDVTPPTAYEKRTKNGTRLPDDWQPDDPDFANEILGVCRAAAELEKFRDYWRAAAGLKGVKLDWYATWRNWVRTANERSPKNGARPLTYFQQQREEMKNALARLGTSREATAELFSANPIDRPAVLHRRDGATVFGVPRLVGRTSDPSDEGPAMHERIRPESEAG